MNYALHNLSNRCIIVVVVAFFNRAMSYGLHASQIY